MLERYGMTEFAMALSNPLKAQARQPGYVGVPLPSVEVAICQPVSEAADKELARAEPDNDSSSSSSRRRRRGGAGGAHLPVKTGEAGELRVRGPGVFTEYRTTPLYDHIYTSFRVWQYAAP